MSIGEGPWPLPSSWSWAPASVVGDVTLGRQRSPEYHTGPDMRPYLRSANITWAGWDLSDVKEMNFDESDFETFRLSAGDVLLNEGSGSADEVGKPAVWEEQIADCCFQNTLLRFRSNELDPWFAHAFFRHAARAGHLVQHTQGVNIFHIGKKNLEQLPLPVAPLAEQRRIVAKLDVLTARIVHARAELDRVPVLARHFRNQTVRSAYRGELTAAWRAENWAQHAISDGSSDLPAGWRWTTLGELAQIKSGVTLGKKRPAEVELVQVPYLRVANVQRGALNLAVIKQVAVTPAEAGALYLRRGDILLNEGGDRDKLGRGWVWSGEIDNCIHQNHVFRARLIENKHSPKYVSFYANEFGQNYFVEHGTQTTNLASISKGKLSALPIPLAPPEEQSEIVMLLERAFTRADRLEAEAARARALLDRLESAILAKAFRGELVPQDPNDEPASVLLERIWAQRAAVPKQKRGRGAAA